MKRRVSQDVSWKCAAYNTVSSVALIRPVFTHRIAEAFSLMYLWLFLPISTDIKKLLIFLAVSLSLHAASYMAAVLPCASNIQAYLLGSVTTNRHAVKARHECVHRCCEGSLFHGPCPWMRRQNNHCNFVAFVLQMTLSEALQMKYQITMCKAAVDQIWFLCTSGYVCM